MRQLGTLPDAAQAQTLADYLSTLSIKTQVAPDSDGHAIWVCEEDQVARAREEFQAYLQNPADERYRRVSPPPRRAEEPRPAPRRRRRPPGRPQYPLTVVLFVGSLVATLCYHARDSRLWVLEHLFIADITLENGQPMHMPSEGLLKARQGEVWRLVTPIFIHLSAIHILMNMLALFFLCPPIERRYGAVGPSLLVLVLATVPNVCQYYFGNVSLEGMHLSVKEPNPYFGGMSGVLFGLFGFVWMKAVYEPGCGLTMDSVNIVIMMGWLILCMTGVVGPIANMAHLAGLALGMILGYTGAWWNGFGVPPPEA